MLHTALTAAEHTALPRQQEAHTPAKHSLWLVISSYRNDEDVIRILDEAHSGESHLFDKILVVDSKSTGTIPRFIRERGWNDVLYRSYDYNLGSGGNLRERLLIAAEHGATHAYAINHDGYIDPQLISRLMETASSMGNVGAVYPLSYFTSLRRYNLSGTRELPLPAKFVSSIPKARLLDAFWGSSHSALYALEPVRSGIAPWESMWMGWEDLEYGWQLSSNGYRQVIVCDAIFRDNYEYHTTHLGRLSNKPAWRTYYRTRNLLLAVRRSRSRPLFYAVAAGRVLLDYGLILFRHANKKKRMQLLFAGAVDGLRRSSLQNEQLVNLGAKAS